MFKFFIRGTRNGYLPDCLPGNGNYRIRTFISCLWLLGICSCNSNYVPRPKGYFKIDLPEHQYTTFDQPGYPYKFEYPVYASVVKDSSYFGEAPENPWWINIDFPSLNGRIYVSYNVIGGKATYKVKISEGNYKDSIAVNSFANLMDGSFRLTYKHSSKASSIEDSVIKTKKGIHGIFFRVGGNAATANQFFLTDTVRHFLRGALYFDTTPNEDSLKPVNDFLMEDMLHLIETFEWKKG
jgi:gliding motility-associated lipoprotein GldD